MVNIKELKELIALMNEHQLVEIELEREGMKIRLRKGGSGVITDGVSIERVAAGATAPQGVAASAPAEAAPKPAGTEIKSPMVGTFYRSAGPGKSAFVEKGADVKKGDILCIVEAMKIMNDINSTMDGKLLDILVENGETVEYGQPLFVIQKK